MFSLIRNTPTRSLLTKEAPAMLAAMVLAEIFYKFHSFTLECIAFLFTWFVTDLLMSKISDWSKHRRALSGRS